MHQLLRGLVVHSVSKMWFCPKKGGDTRHNVKRAPIKKKTLSSVTEENYQEQLQTKSQTEEMA